MERIWFLNFNGQILIRLGAPHVPLRIAEVTEATKFFRQMVDIVYICSQQYGDTCPINITILKTKYLFYFQANSV